jgi:hypothetical protein
MIWHKNSNSRGIYTCKMIDCCLLCLATFKRSNIREQSKVSVLTTFIISKSSLDHSNKSSRLKASLCMDLTRRKKKNNEETRTNLLWFNLFRKTVNFLSLVMIARESVFGSIVIVNNSIHSRFGRENPVLSAAKCGVLVAAVGTGTFVCRALVTGGAGHPIRGPSIIKKKWVGTCSMYCRN